MTLYFLRHGPAGDPEKWKGDDAVRPLTPGGKKVVAQVARTLSKLNLDIDVIITSPLVRAHQTAEITARKLKLSRKLKVDDHLAHGFKTTDLKAILQGRPAPKAAMIVGHEPEFSQVISKLTGGSRIEIKKGGVACVELQVSSLKGTLMWLATPKTLTW